MSRDRSQQKQKGKTPGLSRFLFAGHKNVSAFIFNKYNVDKRQNIGDT